MRLQAIARKLRRSIYVVGMTMSEDINNSINSSVAALTADQLSDKKIVKQLIICIVAMMGIAVAIVTTANFIA